MTRRAWQGWLAGLLGLVLLPAARADRPDAAEVFADPAVVAFAEALAEGRIAAARRAAAGVDLAARGDKGVTLLQWSLLNRQAASLTLLLDRGADPTAPGLDGDTVVHLAAMANDPRYLRLLMARGVSPDLPNGITGATPLRSALIGGREPQFRALLAAGADPNAADRMGNTPLHVAAQINATARVLDLLHAGADPRAVNAQGATFQRYLFQGNPSLRNARARQDIARIVAWLEAHDVPVATDAR